MKTINRDCTLVIIGTGFGGISAAINARRLGITDFVMLERRLFFGGTWEQNRYPGAAVDVQSILYSLEDEPFDWTQMYAEQKELSEYTRHIVKKHKLEEKIMLSCNVSTARFNEQKNKWIIETDDESHHFTARMIINATGPLSTPLIPQIERAEQFEGVMFHCNDWPKDYDLSNKEVAIIGSGASAVQIVPAIVNQVSQLHVFQRTPHWIIPRKDKNFGIVFRRLLKNKLFYKLLKQIIYLLLELRVIGFKYYKFVLSLFAGIPAKKLLNEQVNDSKLREKLTPDFTIGCKRILISNTFYPSLQENNCALHDSEDGIKGFTKNGIVTNKNKEIKVDTVVFATGYKAADSIVSYEVIGRDQICLNDQWASYPRAYLGTTMPNFPNFFVLSGPNTGIGHTSAIYLIESQMKYINQCLTKLIDNQAKTIEPTIEAEEKYTQNIHQEMKKTVWYQGGCNSWYQNADGKVVAIYPGFSFYFRQLCKRWKQNDHLIN